MDRRNGGRAIPIAAAISTALVAWFLASCAGGPRPQPPEPVPARPEGSQSASAARPEAAEPSPEQKRIRAVEAAATLLDEGDAAGAAEKLGVLASASPEDTSLKLAQLAALVSAGKLGEARKGVDALLESDPLNVGALSMGAELARFGGDEKGRRSYLDRALAAAPTDAAVLGSWGDYYLDSKAWPKAEDFYRRALAADPRSADASLGLGRALYREAKYPESEAELTKAIALEPASPLAYSDRSRARYQQGKYKESEEDLDSAIAKAPDESWLYLDRGRYLLDKGDMKGAESDFNRAIALDPGYFLSYAYRGGIREEAGRDEEALADYRKVIELYPEYWYSFESAGATAFRLGLWFESATDFQRAYSAAPDRYEYAIAGAIALWRSGKPKEASAYAGKIAPGIDREKNGIYWSMLRLLQDQSDASSELELKIQAEKRLDLKSAMLFYLSEYWLCRGKAALAAKYLSLGEEMKRQGTLEYRLLQAELRRLGERPNG
jgi:tetratricopeptide (TPR) repeat protein